MIKLTKALEFVIYQIELPGVRFLEHCFYDKNGLVTKNFSSTIHNNSLGNFTFGNFMSPTERNIKKIPLRKPKGFFGVHEVCEVKAVKGNKDDKKDSKWIGDLFRLGLVPGSYIPVLLALIAEDDRIYGETLMQPGVY